MDQSPGREWVMSSKGLEGVVVADTGLSKIYGEEGRLLYRGYEIEDLAENVTFEEVCHLLWYGSLPTQQELDELRALFAKDYAVDPKEVVILRRLPPDTLSTATLRTAASYLSSYI